MLPLPSFASDLNFHGPNPIGFKLNSVRFELMGGIFPQICSGRIPVVRICRKAGYDSLKRKIIWLFPFFSIFTPRSAKRRGLLKFGSWMLTYVKATSSDVKGTPSCQRAFLSVNVNVF